MIPQVADLDTSRGAAIYVYEYAKAREYCASLAHGLRDQVVYNAYVAFVHPPITMCITGAKARYRGWCRDS